MAYQWNSLDSGILRRNKTDTKQEQLLVFGYSCKIFRDDEKALEIDQGKHLIPWMGHDNLKIDRYDCRGALFDLKTFEAGKEGYDGTGWLDQNESDRKLEELCDHERYYSLIINEEEEEMYKEEEVKRKMTNSFHYNYGVNDMSIVTEPAEGIPTVAQKEEEEQPYVPSPILDVPIDIEIPKTLKEYARIEKTALFVCEQGLQMQILIKAKQANNPQFNFLSANDPLHKFYQHVSVAFKNGRYKPQCDKNSGVSVEANISVTNEDTDQEDTDYLHPSLLSSNKLNEHQPANFMSVPSVSYRPSADCAYSQLVNRIQSYSGQNLDNQSDSDSVAVAAATQAMTAAGFNNGSDGGGGENYPISNEQQYYYLQQWHEYWKQYSQGNEQSAFLTLPTEVQNYIQQLQQQMAWAQYNQQLQSSLPSTKLKPDNSYAQIVSNLNKKGNPYTANMPQLPPPPPQELSQRSDEEHEEQKQEEADKSEKTKPSLLSLAAAYGSDTDLSESDNEHTENLPIINEIVSKKTFSLPPDNVRLIIDKMAEYVTINGAKFEEIIKKKNDPRFSFLTSEHEFFKYYKSKLKEHGERQWEEKDKENKDSVEKKPKKVIAPVSFSIKKPKEEPTKEIKSALPVEESSDEEEFLLINVKTASHTIPTKDAEILNRIQTISTKIVPTDVTINNSTYIQPMELPPPNTENISQTPPPPSIDDRWPQKSGSPSEKDLIISIRNQSKSPPVKNNHASFKKKKPVLIDMFDAGDEDNDKKIKETKEHSKNDDDHILMRMIELENYEKNLSDEKEKALQLERKRKAAMFLKMKSATTNRQALPPKLRTPSPPLIGNIGSRSCKRVRGRSSELKNKKIEKKPKINGSNENVIRSIAHAGSSRSSEQKKDKKKKKDRGRSKSRTTKYANNNENDKQNEDENYSAANDKEDRKDKSKKKSRKRKQSHTRSTHNTKSKKKSKKHHKKSRSRSRRCSCESKFIYRSRSSLSDDTPISSSCHTHRQQNIDKMNRKYTSSSSKSRSRSKSICSHISVNDSS